MLKCAVAVTVTSTSLFGNSDRSKTNCEECMKKTLQILILMLVATLAACASHDSRPAPPTQNNGWMLSKKNSC
ncbi:exported protein of unknown function [Pseudodesulfovibrio piezophilus C1TLV30]|uniref:Uncharacterized protein n=1 Tax=Pseudodesulfovibrio piezophilus (strain DSM 21447 / JCM 15486 / C1TLV30) TaxID=1322246 RepID=M1WKU3_PSEP2|nr:exported protein of unknown function [Pseudodesulfovibrio piezophilus C1TLV30]